MRFILSLRMNSKFNNLEAWSLIGTDLRVLLFVLFVCFVALRPKSTAMVMAGRSVYIITLFPGQA